MIPGRYNIPTITRGDTLPGWSFQLTEDGEAMAVLSARLQVRTMTGGSLVTSWDSEEQSITITGGGTLAFGDKPAAETAVMPTGAHLYDLEVKLAGGDVLTLVRGNFTILPDITQ